MKKGDTRSGINIEANLEAFKIFEELKEQFPQLRRQMMGYVGKEAKLTLKKEFLSGQSLRYKGTAYAKASDGRRKITYRVLRWGQAVRVSSYPLNLFEHGRTLRSGGKEPAKNVMPKFRTSINSKLQGIISAFDRMYLTKDLDKISSRRIG